jgi:hypothetical protein
MEWFEYLESGSAPEGMQEHIADCVACRHREQRLIAAQRQLVEAGKLLRERNTPDAQMVSAARARVFDRAARESQTLEAIAGGELTLGRLRLLEMLVRPACGNRTSGNLMAEAARRTRRRDAAWSAFIENVAELFSGLCGEMSGRMVLECGRRIP